MHVAIVGAAGMLGRKLAAALAAGVPIGGVAPTRLTLVDVVPAPAPEPAAVPIMVRTADIARPETAAALIATAPDILFHIAATAMGQADSDFAAGYRINFDTTRSLLEAIRTRDGGPLPRFVYASSIGVYAPPFPALIPDDFPVRPDSSYGVQKAMCELLLDDYARRGFVDAVGLRLPTLAVRPGPPTFGNSGFFSNIVREPLAGREAVLPVAPTVRHWMASPRSAVGFLLHAAALDGGVLGAERTLTLPGLSVSVAEELEALERIAGPAALARVRFEPDAVLSGAAYPAAFAADRARALGFALAERSFDDVLRFHIEDDFG
ncbi:NAD-dependent epimerase/dehydratase family protein [Prosthecomicrobium pneumaticum]|uniref:Nucleoside-diphosphate-sugar epimerase n=1 Tax=Prosthecomicrobium pneumaticum TaxID=81895 RepID=A0A7W9FL05_9HYPH|nr:NAD-dependent epimerase/dehydratase family protein [Prosthecomicrobium pneumaticum]MBB5751859.1 nucleoside-diphosphate-sugar epimerase [Prosthecomicrobium pneumaticum]